MPSPTPTPILQRLRKFLSPRMVERIITETVDSTRRVVPTPGTPHPDPLKYPNHIFSFATSGREDGLLDTWVYVEEVTHQDEYNFEHTEADIGGTKFSQVVRTYLQLREGWTPEQHTQGEAMPNVPAGLFATDFILARAGEKRTGDEALDSLFVIKELTYVQRCSISQVILDIQTGNSKRSVTNHYFLGEQVGGVAIEELAADPNDPYWGLQSDGTFRELQQISENWFTITESNAVASGGGPLGTDNPAKTRVVTRPTPIVGDIVFYETGIMPTPVPAYGSAHYDTSTYPNHKLALIRPADKTGLLYEFVYVADRASQDLYNAEFTQADIGGSKFNAIKRTYVTPRASFAPNTPAQGAVMTNALSGASGTYILAERQQVRSGDQEIDNLYVVDIHTYVKRASLVELETNNPFRVVLKKLTVLYYRGETISGTPIETLALDASNAYWQVQSDGSLKSVQQISDNWWTVIEASVGTPPSEAAQAEYGFEHAVADLGGTKFNAVTRTILIPRASYSATSPAPGTAMSNVPAGVFTGYILEGRQSARSNDPQIDAFLVIEKQTYIQRATIADINTDPTLGVGVQKLTTLYYRGETVAATTIQALFAAPTNAYWGVQSDGLNREGQQLTDNWFAVIETSSRDAALLAYKQVLPTTVNLDLPDVLTSVSVVWNKAESAGGFNSNWLGEAAWSPNSDVATSLGGAEDASAESAASIQPDINIEIKQRSGKNIPATACFFFMKLTDGVLDPADFLTRLTAIMGGPVTAWPSFAPEAHSIICLGQKVGVSARASGSAQNHASGNADTGEGNASHEKNEGSGVSYDVSTSNNVTRIPPTIHGPITFSGVTEDTATAAASCDVGWTGGGTGEVIAGISTVFPDVDASASGTKDAVASVTPSSLSATVPAGIPSSGLYVVESRIQPSEPNWVQCFAEVIDASLIP